MKYPPRGLIQEPISRPPSSLSSHVDDSLKLRSHDIGVFLHVLYDSVNILEESHMAELIYLVMTDRLIFHHISDII